VKELSNHADKNLDKEVRSKLVECLGGNELGAYNLVKFGFKTNPEAVHEF
jgi:hypothetical protein